MRTSCYDPRHRPRELRRRVVLPARMRHDLGWTDACILNVSSRGLMIQARGQSQLGDVVEIHHGAQRILARVVWRDGVRSGLQLDEQLGAEDVLTLGTAAGLQVPAAHSQLVNHPKKPRGAEASRWRGRLTEFAGVIAIAASLCAATLIMLEQAFARPLALVEQALAD